MLLVRERPPLRLSVNVETPSGVRVRWGADDPNPANQPQDLTISTAMPGGFNDMSCTLQRDPRLTYPDIEELSKITVQGPGGQIAWQGRLEQLPDTGGSQSQLSPQCVGYQSALDDNSGAAMVYVDCDLTTWQGPPLDRQIGLTAANRTLGSESVGASPATNDPALILEIDGTWGSPINPQTEAWYDSQIAGPIATVYYAYTPGSQIDTSDSNWELSAYLSADDSGTSVEGTGALAVAGASAYFTPGTPCRYAFVSQIYSATPGGGDNSQYQALWRLAVYGNHGLPGHGPDPAGFLASDVVAHALATWAPSIAFTTGSDGTIQPSTFVIPQLVFNTPGTSSTIIKQAAQYELLDWAVWEGPTFYLNPLGQSVKTRNWRTRVGECQLQETGPNVSRIFNGCLVTFTNLDGTSGTVGPPGSGALTTSSDLVDTSPSNPANQAGIDRWALLQMGTTTPAAAIQVGGQYLQAQAELDTSGQASIVGHVQDDSGVWWAAWAMRAGDTLTVVDSSNTSARRIVSTSYDDSSKTNSVQLDQPPDTEDALLERMSEVIASIGLS